MRRRGMYRSLAVGYQVKISCMDKQILGLHSSSPQNNLTSLLITLLPHRPTTRGVHQLVDVDFRLKLSPTTTCWCQSINRFQKHFCADANQPSTWSVSWFGRSWIEQRKRKEKKRTNEWTEQWVKKKVQRSKGLRGKKMKRNEKERAHTSSMVAVAQRRWWWWPGRGEKRDTVRE